MRLKIASMLAASLSVGATTDFVKAAEVTVVSSHAACKDTSTVEQFEAFERNDDDQGYKRLFFQKGASKDCIFLRSGEILVAGETKDRWVCVKESESSPCYWTAGVAVEARKAAR